MITKLEEVAQEGSSYTVTLSGWLDAAGQSVTPDTLTWTLCTPTGEVINARDAVSITPAASVVVLLYGDDLALLTAEDSYRSVERVLIVEGTYDSSLGSDLPLHEEYRFVLRAVTR